MSNFVYALFDTVKSSGTPGHFINSEATLFIILFLVFLGWNIFLTFRCWFLKLDIKDNKNQIDEFKKKIDDMKKE